MKLTMLRMFLPCILLAYAVFGERGRVIAAGSHLQLMVDASLIERTQGISLQLHSPIRREVVFKFDAAWEGPESGYVTVLQDGTEYRMYYRGGGENTEEVTAMATSRDGVHWDRPNLGLCIFSGNTSNNIVYKGRKKAYWESHNFTPFIDSNPQASPEQRYKAVGLGRQTLLSGDTAKALVPLASSNGINWKLVQETPIITKGSFDSQNVVFWDTQKREYVCYLRHGREVGDGKKVRSVMRATSQDFLHWTDPVWVEFEGPHEQFYTSAIIPYFRDPTWYLGFPMRFVPERKTVGYPPRTVDALSDAVFITSRDGIYFNRTFPEAFIRPGLEIENWGNGHGNNTPAWGLLPTAKGEISIYWAEHYGGTPQLRRGTLRTDGFASANALATGGEFVTKPLMLRGSKLVVNYSTSAVGSIRVELQSASGTPLPGFGESDCSEIYGDELEHVVTWNNAHDLSAILQKPVKLRFVMKDADLYSFCALP